jgi:hypothetical protein
VGSASRGGRADAGARLATRSDSCSSGYFPRLCTRRFIMGKSTFTCTLLSLPPSIPPALEPPARTERRRRARERRARQTRVLTAAPTRASTHLSAATVVPEALERVIRARTGRNECRASTGRRAGRVLPSPRLSGRRGAGVAVRTGTKRRPAEVDHTDTGRLRRWGQRKMLTLVCLWGNANSPNRILQASWSARRPQAP